jgi:MFS family permease
MAIELGPPDEFSLSGVSGRRSRVRWQVLAVAVLLAAITYLDRVCIAQTAADIRRDLGLSEQQMGFVFSAFTLAYAVFEIPTGAWGDRVGIRRVLTRIVVWWSSFTVATAAAFNYTSILLVRFLFGMGEAGAFPSVSKAFSRWFPVVERGTAQGIFFAGAHLGGGLTPLLVSALLNVMTWRWVFIVFGSIGFVWALGWYRWFRDEPAEHPDVSEEERKYIEGGRLKEVPHRLDAALLGRVLASRNMIALCLMYFTQAYGFYFNMTWLPTFLKEKAPSDSSVLLLGLLSGLPLILSALADLFGGVTTDRLTRAYGLRVGRCGIGGASLLIAGLAILGGATTDHHLVAALLIALAGAADSFLLGAAWGTCLDIAGPHAGLVTATMNSAGQVGAFLSPLVFPLFLKQTPRDWTTPLLIMGGLYLAGAVCWLFVDPRRPIEGISTRHEEPDAENLTE